MSLLPIFALAGALVLSGGVWGYRQHDRNRKLERELAELQRFDEQKTGFISSIGHDLRTPLTVIRGGLVLMREAASGGARAEDLEQFSAMLDRQVVQLNRLITDLMEFSRLESRSMTYAFEPCEARELLHRSEEALILQCEAKSIALSMEPGDQVPLLADPHRMGQVINNLIGNAIKFTPPGGRITLRVKQEGEVCRLEVADTGEGIDPEHHARVFEKFYQVEQARSREFGGSGLGLAICKAIVEDGHQGQIWVESHRGAGATFVVELPIRRIS